MYEQTKTVSGADVVIYQRNVGEEQAIHGAYHDGQGAWYVAAWDNKGRFNPQCRVACDLVESLSADQPPAPECA